MATKWAAKETIEGEKTFAEKTKAARKKTCGYVELYTLFLIHVFGSIFFQHIFVLDKYYI